MPKEQVATEEMAATVRHDPQVLIAGAGPTGLVLALLLTRMKIRVRIVDPAPEPGTTSRALAVQGRTLEFYQQLGIAHFVAERGTEFNTVNLWVRGQKDAHVTIGDIGAGLSPHPSPTIFPQDEHERLLVECLSAAGVEVERGTSVTSFTHAGSTMRVQLALKDGRTEMCEATFLAGCDGAHSRIRQTLGATFLGGTYSHVFYVADVEATGPVTDGQLHVALDDADFLAVFPMKGQGRVRLVGSVRTDVDANKPLTWADVGQGAMTRLGLSVSAVNWFSTYKVHHRVANHFQRGQVFLLGDAAHVHSPVGGQGMNTGIGDAMNLAWKLAAVIHGQADIRILNTYEPERIAFARQLVDTTDRAFTFVTNNGPLARWVRLQLVPRILPVIFSLTPARRFMFRTISQIGIRYRSSSLSAGQAGGVHGGDRLPWVPPEGDGKGVASNFAPLASLTWQVHVYGDATPGIAAACDARDLPLHTFPWRPAMRGAGLRRGAVYLVRPDGYVALADATADPATLHRFLDDRGLQPGATARDPA